MKIYTRTGDKGTSSLYDGTRVSKTNAVFTALGDCDELNAHVGVALEQLRLDMGIFDNTNSIAELVRQLETIQSRLLDVGSRLATPLSTNSQRKLKKTQFDQSHVDYIESWIDTMELELPPLKNFILPSGGLSASQLHVARTICRRAERSATLLVDEEVCDPIVSKYLNRLSDYLFVAARFAARTQGKPETIYQKIDANDQNNENLNDQ